MRLEGQRRVVGGMLEGHIQRDGDLWTGAVRQRGDRRAGDDVEDVCLHRASDGAPTCARATVMLSWLEVDLGVAVRALDDARPHPRDEVHLVPIFEEGW